MTLDDQILQLVEAFSLEQLIAWADLLGVQDTIEQWLDDDYPDKENELRVDVAEAFMKVGEK